MSFKKYLQETAMGGSIGAGSIAANPSGDSKRGDRVNGEHQWHAQGVAAKEDRARREKQERYHAHAKETLNDLKKKKKKKSGFKNWILRRMVSEEFDMNDIVSRLKNADTETTGADVGVVSYGVEDDKKNVMRITVRADQAKEFEETIARQLADNKDNKKNGINLQGNSLAEILYNLRDKFEIVSVDFPIIPKDVVYNADMASKTPENGFASDVDTDDDFGASFDEFGQDGGMDDDMNDEMSQTNPMAVSGDGSQSDMSDENGSGIEGSVDELNPDMDGEGVEDDNVEDFGMESPDEGDEESILKSIVAMLKAQANATEAQAEAAAEESRAKQAEWSAIAADKEVRRQEELARVSAEVQAQKKKEKAAKQYADLARYNVSKSSGSAMESKSFLMDAVKILKEDQFDNVQTLQKEKLQLQVKYKIQPQDDVETQNYKKQMYQFDLNQLNARIKAAQLSAQYNADLAKKQQNPNQQQPQQPQNSQQPQSPNPQQPQVPNTAPNGLNQ